MLQKFTVFFSDVLWKNATASGSGAASCSVEELVDASDAPPCSIDDESADGDSVPLTGAPGTRRGGVSLAPSSPEGPVNGGNLPSMNCLLETSWAPLETVPATET